MPYLALRAWQRYAQPSATALLRYLTCADALPAAVLPGSG
jgi:hypothetical protein